MAKLSQADLMSQFKEMSLVELSEFVKAFETEFDVTAAAPVAAAAAVTSNSVSKDFTKSLSSTSVISLNCANKSSVESFAMMFLLYFLRLCFGFC